VRRYTTVHFERWKLKPGAAAAKAAAAAASEEEDRSGAGVAVAGAFPAEGAEAPVAGAYTRSLFSAT